MNVEKIKIQIQNLSADKEKLAAQLNFVTGAIAALEAVLMPDPDVLDAEQVADEVIAEIQDGGDDGPEEA